MERLCVFCQHWQFDPGHGPWSTTTAGERATMDCMKGHYGKNFSLTRHIAGEEDFRLIIRTAELCPDYLPVGGG